jgi:zinc transport system permease protein
MACLSLIFSMSQWLEEAIRSFCGLWPEWGFLHYDFNVKALLAVILVSLICGAVGSLVVGSRMAFFSDALAHCAFAGVSVGFVFYELFLSGSQAPFWDYVMPVMVVFGILVGLGITAVRFRTPLATDTVIGVFFAGAIGLAALLRNLMQNRRDIFGLEDFLFGNPLLINGMHLLLLAGLAVLTFLALWWLYNPLLLTGFNSSLALSRRAPVRVGSYLFVALLAVIVNLCLLTIGALLINALLIVPAATVMNCTRNLRQLFRYTVFLSVTVSVSGLLLSWYATNFVQQRSGPGSRFELGIPGTIILLSVGLFVLSIYLGPWMRGQKQAAP